MAGLRQPRRETRFRFHRVDDLGPSMAGVRLDSELSLLLDTFSKQSVNQLLINAFSFSQNMVAYLKRPRRSGMWKYAIFLIVIALSELLIEPLLIKRLNINRSIWLKILI